MQACILITSIASHLSHSSLTPVSYNLSKMGMNRLVEHIHRDHGERDGVQAFAVHPVSCFILVVFVFFEGLDFFFLTSYTISSSSKGRSPHRRNKTAPRNTKWRHLVQRYVPTYSIPFLPSSLPFIHPLKPTIFLTITNQKNRTHRRRNSLRRISHLADIGKTTMVEREISQCDVGCE